MKHLILQFAETPANEPIDTSLLEYNPELNLNVIKGTEQAAVSFAVENKNSLSTLVDTATQTRVNNEVSDTDMNFSRFNFLLDTRTLTHQGDTDR